MINIVGVSTGKWLQNAGGVGTYVPGLILILLGVYGAMTAPPANELSLATLKPDLKQPSSVEPAGFDRVRVRRPRVGLNNG